MFSPLKWNSPEIHLHSSADYWTLHLLLSSPGHPAHFQYLLGPKGTRIVNPDILKCILGCQARTGECEHIVVHTLQNPNLFFFFLFYSSDQDTFSMWDLSSTTRPGIKPPEMEVWTVNHYTSREVPPNPSLCGTVDLVQYWCNFF